MLLFQSGHAVPSNSTEYRFRFRTDRLISLELRLASPESTTQLMVSGSAALNSSPPCSTPVERDRVPKAGLKPCAQPSRSPEDATLGGNRAQLTMAGDTQIP